MKSILTRLSVFFALSLIALPASEAKVVCFGDSITKRGYPDILGKSLGKAVAPLVAKQKATDDPELPNVLLIGDSISLGYTPHVKKRLAGKANVLRIPGNGKYSEYGLENLDKWIGTRKWDLIHFNWGLWDLCYRNPKSKTQGNRDKVDGVLTATPEQYRANLEQILARLKKTEAKLIWCNTTPIPEHEAGRKLGDDARYNKIAEEIMKANGILINDLHSHALLKLPKIQLKKGDVHFTQGGYVHLSQKVAFEITTALDTQDDNASADEKPNFVLIMTDDQGYQDLGCYGSPVIKTPRIDKMAREGMKFTSFYAQTVCGPARAALLTGCYPMRTERVAHDDGLVPHPAMSLNEVTIPELLKPVGYKTAMMGKWDLAGRRTRGKPIFRLNLNPSNQGFAESFWTETSASSIIRSGEETALENPERSSVTKLHTDKALEFIEANKESPFFVYLAHPMPHTPIAASKQFKGTSKGGLYGDVIEELDYHTGRVLDKIEELGLGEKTYIIFTSDNGPWWKQGKHAGHCEPLRSAKTSTYDGGLRVPFIIKAPGKVPGGTTCDLVTAGIDLLPAIVKLAGAKLPDDRVIDGIDISKIFHGKQTELDRPYFFYQHQALRAVRQGDWKLHLPHSKLDRTKEGKLWQTHVPNADRQYIEVLTLYNLKTDIGETTNVAKNHPEIVEKLMKQLEFAKADIGYHDVVGENSRRNK